MAAQTEYRAVPTKQSGDISGKHAQKMEQLEPEMKLEPRITLFNGITIIVGCIIGSGIFISPTANLKESGSVGMSLIVWVICGLFSTIGAICYIELGLMIKKSGADYAYITEAFGPLMGFLRLWIECLVIRPAILTIVGLAFATYTLKPFYMDGEVPLMPKNLLVIACCMFLTWVNCYSVSLAARFQDVFTVAKVVALILIIITGFVFLVMGHTKSFENPFEGTEGPIQMSMAMYAGLFAYNGWNFLNFIIEEFKEPEKNLGKAIFISMTLVTLIYLCVNVAYFALLSKAEMLTTPAVALLFADRAYGWFAWIVPIFVALSCFGTFNGVLLTSSRLFLVGAREGHMPAILATLQIQKITPMPAVIFTAMLSLVYLCFSDNMYQLMNYLSICTWLAIGVSVFCVIWLRWKQPNLPRPYRVNLSLPIIYCLATLYLIVVPTYQDPLTCGMGLAIILLGIPVYYLLIAWKNKPKFFLHGMQSLTSGLQKLMLVVPESRQTRDI